MQAAGAAALITSLAVASASRLSPARSTPGACALPTVADQIAGTSCFLGIVQMCNQTSLAVKARSRN